MNHVLRTKFSDPNGKYHREDGPAVEWHDGTKLWYKHGKLHREGGPAIECKNGSKLWFKHGKCHMEDGPAVKCLNGNKYYYLEDNQYTEREYWEKVKELGKCKLFKLDKGKICWI